MSALLGHTHIVDVAGASLLQPQGMLTQPHREDRAVDHILSLGSSDFS